MLHRPSTSAAQARCDRAALQAAATTLTARDVRVPPHRQRSRQCLSVGDGGVVLGTPVAVSMPGAPCALAVTFKHTIALSETCGYDVHYEPLELTGVALVRRAGGRFRTITSGHFPMRDLAGLSVHEDGAPLRLEGQPLVLQRGRLVLATGGTEGH